MPVKYLSTGIALALASTGIYAGAMGPVETSAPGSAYIGVFGGGGTSTRSNIAQYGTAFFTEAQGGPLAVNAFGRSNTRSVGLVGAHVGYQWGELNANPFSSHWGLVPAVELEGYYMGRGSFVGHDISSDTNRLDEHDFLVTYPMKTGVFLTNAVLTINPSESRLHPYIGAGIGGAVISINNATSTQTAPPEANVNHYSANPNDKQSTFATQAKLGLSYSLCKNFNIFAEYRWLYLASTQFTFGSTIAPGHAATSSWTVNLGSQNYNTGVVGIQYNIA